MYLTGFADEAGQSLTAQIKATETLGWNAISARSIDGKNIHELSDPQFDKVVRLLEKADIRIPEFGSLIGNWGKTISTDFDVTLAERLRAIHQRFADEGIQALHENCMNWGGFSSDHTLRLVEEVPGMKLIFDTGNPIFQRDRSKSEPHPFQDAFGFYNDVREHIAHVHIKDCRYPARGQSEPVYTMPGDGDANLLRILRDLKAHRYNGGFSMEPHVATVFHAENQKDVDWDQCFDSYVEYGKRFEDVLDSIDWKPVLFR